MCGRYTLTVGGEVLAEVFDLAEAPVLAPRYNIAPTTDVLAIRAEPDGRRWAQAMRWGMVPPRTESLAGSRPIFNARSETVATRGMFRWAFRRRRCIVPADGWYEWRKFPSGRVPFRFCLADRRPFAMAGIWSEWVSPEGEIITACSVLTTPANELAAPIHDRMPALLDERTVQLWLSPELEDVAVLQPLLAPAPSRGLCVYPVSRRVNSARNDDSELIERDDSHPEVSVEPPRQLSLLD